MSNELSRDMFDTDRTNNVLACFCNVFLVKMKTSRSECVVSIIDLRLSSQSCLVNHFFF